MHTTCPYKLDSWPRRQTKKPDVRYVDPCQNVRSLSWSEWRSKLSKRPRVLLADDYPEMLKAVSRLLAVDCDIVGTLADGSALLETARRLQPDIVVLDVNLPNVRSLEACREITRAHPQIRVIMFTALNDREISRVFLDAGASAFVSKLAAGELLETIKRLCVDPLSPG